MNNQGAIAKQFMSDDMRRRTRLERMRKLAVYTIPSTLPEENQNVDDQLPETFQSVGSRGVMNLEGKLVTAMFPAGTFWARFNATEEIKGDPSALDDVESSITGQPVTRLQAFEEMLFLRELKVQSVIDGTNYRNQMRMNIRGLLILGSSLSKVMDNYNLKTFREDQYVLYRDPSQAVIYLITKERVDPLTLSPELQAKAAIEPEKFEGKESHDRSIDIYTRASLQPGGGWLIEQEINGHIVATSEEPVSPYIVGAYDLISSEHYGRPFCEQHQGDLRSINGLYRSMLEIAAVMGRLIPIIDDTAGTTRRKDVVETPNGEPIMGRVQNGKAADVAFLQADKFGDLQGVMAVAKVIEERLSKAFLIESELQPSGDRVTAFQVARLASEIEGALGGVYAAIAERLQRPLLNRVIYQMIRDKKLSLIPREAVTVQNLTGLEALSRERDLQKLNFIMQTFSAAPEMLERMNLTNLAHQFIKLAEVDPRGLVKSEAQVQQERQAAQQAAMQQIAAEQGVKSLGTIAEQQAAAAAKNAA